jgi:rhamnosyltransferase
MIGISVVLYNPNSENLKRWSSLVLTLDDSKYSISFFANDQKNYTFSNSKIFSGGGKNLGLGVHNINVDYLIGVGCNAILTLDQDTILTENTISMMYSTLLKMPENYIVGPCMIGLNGEVLSNQYYENFYIKNPTENDLIEVPFLITSGMMVKSKRWIELGGYYSELFIGDLDVEFCIRNRKRGGKNIKINAIQVQHDVGKGRIGYFFLNIVKHEPTRYYYYLRNKLKLIREKRYSLNEIIPTFLYLLAIFLTLPKNSNRSAVLRYSLKGVVDGWRKLGGELKF